jgi:hypothetical protein
VFIPQARQQHQVVQGNLFLGAGEQSGQGVGRGLCPIQVPYQGQLRSPQLLHSVPGTKHPLSLQFVFSLLGALRED